jgi:NADP-dependent 3-hydroxy acid dehydrogenase YdfG/Tfp pilus assembly protein PilF
MKLFIAYASDNADAAQYLASDLSQYLTSVTLFDQASPQRAAIISELQNTKSAALVLLMSENFLKAANMMDGMLSLVQQLEPANRLFAVLTDNIKTDGSPEEADKIRLDLDRSSIVINYQNYWTDTYLSLRKEKWNIASDQTEEYDKKVVTARNISNEIAAFLRLIRNMGYAHQDILASQNYKVLFEKIGVSGNPVARPQPVIEDKTPVVVETPVVEIPAPIVETVAEVVAETPAVEIQTPIVEIVVEVVAETPVAEIPAPIVETVAEVVVQTPVAEVQTPIVETVAEVVVETPVAEVQTPIVETVAEVVVETPAAEIPAPIVETVAEVVVETPVVAVQTPIVETVAEVVVETPAVAIQTPIVETVAKPIAAPIAQTLAEQQYAEAFAAYKNEDFDRAKDILEDTIQSNRKIEAPYLLLGTILEEHDGDYLLAKNYYEKVLTINPDSAEAYYRLGRVVQRLFPRQYIIAGEYYKRGLEIAPEHAAMNFLYGKLLANSFKRYTRARRHFRTTIRTESNHAGAYLELAKLYQSEFGEPEKARKYYMEAVRIEPSYNSLENQSFFDVDADEMAALLNPLPNVERRHTTVLITGATSGIGLATARLLAAQGFRLILNGRRIERLNALCTELRNNFQAEVLELPFDVRNAENVFAAIGNLPTNWKNIDVLLNNAGLAKGLAPIHEGELAHWDNMIDTNIKGLLYVTRAVAPSMVARKTGHIVNVSSLAGKEVYFKGNVYCATKFAVDALTKSMRIDLHSHGIRVSSVSPGHVEETEFASVRFDGDTQKAAIYNDFQPLTARDVAESIAFLLTTPEHVGIHDIQLAGTQQAAATTITRSGRAETEVETGELAKIAVG